MFREGQSKIAKAKQSLNVKLVAIFNAAKNILAAGHAVLACGEFELSNSMKQEPLRNCEKVAA